VRGWGSHRATLDCRAEMHSQLGKVPREELQRERLLAVLGDSSLRGVRAHDLARRATREGLPPWIEPSHFHWVIHCQPDVRHVQIAVVHSAVGAALHRLGAEIICVERRAVNARPK
jgi:hypothetical protein